jgi:hypothetical protein
MRAVDSASMPWFPACLSAAWEREITMNQPRPLRLALLLALCVAATAQADSLLPRAAGVSAAADQGCTGALRAAAGVGETRVIFHDGSHAPVSVPVTARDESSTTVDTSASSTAALTGGGGASAIVLPSAEPAKPRSGPRWQTFLPGSLK